jgi:ADP-heptose:LPS heptosyltransferase
LNNFKEVRKIAVLLPNKNFFGAQIVIIPFFKKLKRLFPAAYIMAVSPGPEFNALKEQGLFDRLILSEKGISGFKNTAKKIRDIRPDILFTLRRKSERDWLFNIFSGAREKIGFRRRWSPLVYDKLCRYDKNSYRSVNFLKLLQFYDKESINYTLNPDAEHAGNSTAWLIPCGSKKEKLWPVDNYITLAKKINKQLKYKIVFVLGPAEQNLEEYIISRLDGYIKPEFIISAGVKELLRKAQSCALAVTNDCGPGHIAQISGVPAVVLFEKGANVNEWVNSSGKSRPIVSFSGSIAGISPEEVFDKLLEDEKSV